MCFFLSLQYIVLVIVVFVLQTIGGILAFTYREEVSYNLYIPYQVDNMRMHKGGAHANVISRARHVIG